MLGGDTVKPSNDLWLTVPQLKANLRSQSFLACWLIPFIVYLILCLVYTYGFISVPSMCILLTIFFGLVCAALVYMRNRGPLFMPLAVATLIATGTGTLIGLYVYDQFAVFPRFYANSRLYTNVVPSQPSAAVADAGKIVFSGESMVDAQRSAGYITEDGYTYCAAPVRDNSGITQVEFWAVGIGCCAERGDFYCDESADPQAHAGVVVFDNNGFFDMSRRDIYEKARLKAEASFSLQSVEEPMYVRWVREDNMDLLSRYYSTRASAYVLVIGFLHLLGSFGLATLLYKPNEPLLAR
mmetsp:Transcript_54049/g.173308  ORF Transcript_54049/g.173308 Transcript_54049/m.173308 type:complete len:297 (-) Transcript_54049:124-1014(-)